MWAAARVLWAGRWAECVRRVRCGWGSAWPLCAVHIPSMGPSTVSQPRVKPSTCPQPFGLGAWACWLGGGLAGFADRVRCAFREEVRGRDGVCVKLFVQSLVFWWGLQIAPRLDDAKAHGTKWPILLHPFLERKMRVRITDKETGDMLREVDLNIMNIEIHGSEIDESTYFNEAWDLVKDDFYILTKDDVNFKLI